MKAAKLLFFADKMHLLRYGRPIIGDDYFCLEHGPIPTQSLNIIQARIAGAEDARYELMEEFFDVVAGSKYPRLRAKKGPDLDVFSDSDVEVLKEVLATYGQKDAWTLRQLTHEQPEVKAADEQRLATGKGSVPLSFESFFDSTQDAMLALLKDDQSSRDFATSLTW
jgi:uncharacterized phage-associated protein